MPRQSKPRAIILANDANWLFRMRAPLVEGLIKAGYEVFCIAPIAADAQRRLLQLGAQVRSVTLDRKSLGAVQTAAFIRQVRQLYRTIKPDAVFHYSPKANVFGNLAAMGLGIRVVINTISGLGFVYSDDGRQSKAYKRSLRFVANSLYRIAFHFSSRVYFQNSDDMAFFLQHGLVSSRKAAPIAGSGIDTSVWQPASDLERLAARSSLNILEDQVVFVLPARMLWDKGIREFADAAAEVRASTSKACCIFVGGVDPGNPATASLEEMTALAAVAGCRWIKHTERMREIYALADVIVLPSYREGMPRVVLEASAMGLPVITTDAVGCRESILDGETGLMVPVRQSQPLAGAMMRLFKDADYRHQLGRHGRTFMQKRFETSSVVNAMIEDLSSLLAASPMRPQDSPLLSASIDPTAHLGP